MVGSIRPEAAPAANTECGAGVIVGNALRLAAAAINDVAAGIEGLQLFTGGDAEDEDEDGVTGANSLFPIPPFCTLRATRFDKSECGFAESELTATTENALPTLLFRETHFDFFLCSLTGVTPDRKGHETSVRACEYGHR